MMDKHAEIAALWHVNPESFQFQNMKVCKDLLEADLGDTVDRITMKKNLELTRKVLSDAAKGTCSLVSWKGRPIQRQH